MKIFFFTKYTRSGASSRYRSLQYLPFLDATGLKYCVSPLFDDVYLAHKFEQGRAHFGHVLHAFARRMWSVLNVPRSAVVVIEYELLPWFPALLERWLALRGCSMVVDYDDALFHQYDSHANPWVRLLLGLKIASVMRLAHTVVAGNAYLADYARRAGVARVEVIPTVVDLAHYKPKNIEISLKVLKIGWIGSPSTARYLRAIAPALAHVCRDRRAQVCLVGSGPLELTGVPVQVIAWHEDTEVDEIRNFDIGIMPLPNEPWARGKCGFKLIQYMACGLPVVASPVGVNEDIVENDTNGFLASNLDEWVVALERLLGDAQLRRRLGISGRQKVQERFCLDATAPQFTALIQSVVKREKV